MKFKRLSLFCFAVLYQAMGFSQMQMGVAHDNINVTEGIRINPALAVDPLPWLDVQLGGLYFFGATNGAYLAADEFSPLTGKFPKELKFNSAATKVDGQVEMIILGPAVNASIGKFSVGVSTAFRNYAVGRNLPKEFTRGLVDGLQIPDYYGKPLNGDNYRTKAISFLEFGVNGGMILHQKGNLIVNVGVNFKYLLGIGGIDFLVDNFNYTMADSSNAYVNNYTGRYGGSKIGFHPGVGYGADIGFTLEKKVSPSRYYKPHSPQSNCKYVDYVYRLGFSILDIGAIKFKGSHNRTVQNASGEWPNYAELVSKDIESVITRMDAIFSNGTTDSKSTYFAKLPLSFSFQFDYNFGKGMFVNTTLVYGVPLKKSFGPERISMLAITPRFEGKRFGISAPLSINTIWKPGLGLAFRFWYLTLGTDNIFPYIINTDVSRFGVYTHLKIPIYINKPCKQRGLGEYDWHFSDCSAPGSHKPRKQRKR